MTESTASVPTPSDTPPSDDAQAPHYRLTQIVVLSAVALCMAIVWYAGALLHIPEHRDHEASLLLQPGAAKVLAMLAAMVLTLACGVLGQLVGGRYWAYAGPFAAALGLSALSMRGGPMRYVLFNADSVGKLGSVPYALAIELILLFVVIGGLWFVVARRARALAAVEDPRVPLKTALSADAIQGLLAQAAIMGFVMMVVVVKDDKKQVLPALFAAAFAGTATAEHFFKRERLVEWFWIAPLVVGLAGYLGSGLTGATADAITGHLSGTFAPLARPLPLDYASFGVAGALLGYWMSTETPEPAYGFTLLNPRGILQPAEPRLETARATPAKPDAAGNGQAD